ncbi:MAG TPA: UDP-N-acetylmuramoyl-L-alanyl-D-glutamate--2,6-diaminopimelate ligase [Steroidobacteraceae bacterium]
MSASLMWLLDGIAAVPGGDAGGGGGHGGSSGGGGIGVGGAQITDLTLDSREVHAGSLFFALAGHTPRGGHTTHGLEFAADAAARGAAVVLWEPVGDAAPPALPAGVYAAAVPQLSSLVGRIADRFFNWPSSQLRITGITGTNGKTTCAYLLAQCLDRLGARAAYIGTLGQGRITALAAPMLAPSTKPTSTSLTTPTTPTTSMLAAPTSTAPTHTTPDAISLHRELAGLRAAGVREVALEVSSHALDQHRIDGVRLHTAAFTNLSRDHLDYHESMAAYGAAKARLFEVPGLQQVVVNIGDAFGRDLAQKLASSLPLTAVWLGRDALGWLAERTVHADEVAASASGISLSLDGSFGKQSLDTRLLGRFNAENALVVIACLTSLGVTLKDAAGALAQCTAPPGRMQVVGPVASDAGTRAAGPRDAATREPTMRGQPMAVVDYAHTPDALAKALGALREHCRGKLWCVFGCGGDRDPGKRRMMGAVADELADEIIVTDDNPRSENPQAITRAIEAGIKSRSVRVIHDRGEAIATALRQASPLDVVLIAGKGHEDYQIYGETRRKFSDVLEAQRCLGLGVSAAVSSSLCRGTA